jgi:Kef-type potassium/proton antiporter, CPA2 family (TC 2.A.37.1)
VNLSGCGNPFFRSADPSHNNYYYFWFLAEWVWHDTTGADIFIGFILALSSTAIVLQALQQNGMIESPAGRISLSILIFQDLMIVPMMLSIPLLAGKSDPDINMAELAITAGKALGIVLVVFVLARKIIPWALYQIIRTKSRELFLLCIIGICIGTAYGTAELGLSLSLGAFMAGLIVAESEYSHSALEGILPFKDVFTSMFFISVGMLLDVTYFLPNITEILLIILLVLFLKTAVVVGVVKILRYPMRTALITGLTLCQVGEFSFVLAKTGLSYSLLSEEHYQLFLASSILTMAATPFW